MKVYIHMDSIAYEGNHINGVYSSVENAMASSPGDWYKSFDDWANNIVSGYREKIVEYEVM